MILKNMKTTEEVIKNKNRLIAGRERYYSFSERLLQIQVGKPIYIVDNYYCKNTIELVKEITPLVYYIISILKTEEENLDKELILLIEFPNFNGVVRVDGRFMIDDENVLACLANSIKDLEDDGYHVTFTQTFELHFLLKDQFLLDYEDEIEEETQEKQKEEKKINTSKSFKSDDCVICMDTPPNVLLCNCGHICICEKMYQNNSIDALYVKQI